MKPRVILADDHTLVAEALGELIAPHFEVLAIVGDGRRLIDAARSYKPDAVVVDVAMPLLNGLEAGRRLRAKMPNLKLIFLTMNQDPELAGEAVRVGASGYVLKTSAASELVQAIRAALQGKLYITPQIARGMEESFIRNPQGKNRPESLTSRQREVLHLLGQGKTMREAAHELNLTPRGIAFHKYRIMRDFRIKTNADFCRFAIKCRISR